MFNKFWKKKYYCALLLLESPILSMFSLYQISWRAVPRLHSVAHGGERRNTNQAAVKEKTNWFHVIVLTRLHRAARVATLWSSSTNWQRLYMCGSWCGKGWCQRCAIGSFYPSSLLAKSTRSSSLAISLFMHTSQNLNTNEDGLLTLKKSPPRFLL